MSFVRDTAKVGTCENGEANQERFLDLKSGDFLCQLFGEGQNMILGLDTTFHLYDIISSLVTRWRERMVLTAFFQSLRVFEITLRANPPTRFQTWGVFSAPAGRPQRILLIIA